MTTENKPTAPLSADGLIGILDKMEVIAQVIEGERLPNTAKALAALIAHARTAQQAPQASVEDARDAARYRWLRDQRGVQGDLPINGDVWVVQFRQPTGAIPELACAGFGSKLDAAIDFAMSTTQEGK